MRKLESYIGEFSCVRRHLGTVQSKLHAGWPMLIEIQIALEDLNKSSV